MYDDEGKNDIKEYLIHLVHFLPPFFCWLASIVSYFQGDVSRNYYKENTSQKLVAGNLNGLKGKHATVFGSMSY